MMPELLKSYLNDGYHLMNKNIERQTHDLLIAARQQDFDMIEKINLEINKQQAVKDFIEALFQTFPGLKD